MQRTLILTQDPELDQCLSTVLASRYLPALGKLKRLISGKAPTTDLLLIDLPAMQKLGTGHSKHPERQGLKVLRGIYPAIPIVILAAVDQIREAVRLIRLGADDYITLPVNGDEALSVLEAASDAMLTQSELSYLRGEVWDDETVLVRSKSARMRTVIEQLERVADTRSTVLLTGETGTGKGMLARLLHRRSSRASEPFVSVHCGAIPDNLVESELFGHERGAFTGADRLRLGKFEVATRGTVLLDEIGTISPSVQVKLLQVLQERSIQRVGGNQDIPVNARIIAATNADLKALSEAGSFREDLYYRLNVFPVEVPPLRDRREDVADLARFFLRSMNAHYSKQIVDIDEAVIRALTAYDWPGNIRELQNLIERAYILEDSDCLHAGGFPGELFAEPESPADPLAECSLAATRKTAADTAERRFLDEQLTLHRGSISRTAEGCQVTPRQLHTLMQKHGLQKERYKTRD
ncbi:MAG: DNA-binding NtrC family response regulator [Rhodothermales bacterium]|jgi:DNA-binding NtrC family response regulator